MSTAPKPKSPRRPGRPSKLDDVTRATLLATLRKGAPRAVACKRARVGISTFQGWLAKGRNATSGEYRELLDAVQSAESEAEVLLCERIIAASATDWRAAMALLERRFPSRWARISRVEAQPAKPTTDAEYEVTLDTGPLPAQRHHRPDDERETA